MAGSRAEPTKAGLDRLAHGLATAQAQNDKVPDLIALRLLYLPWLKRLAAAGLFLAWLGRLAEPRRAAATLASTHQRIKPAPRAAEGSERVAGREEGSGEARFARKPNSTTPSTAHNELGEARQRRGDPARPTQREAKADERMKRWRKGVWSMGVTNARNVWEVSSQSKGLVGKAERKENWKQEMSCHVADTPKKRTSIEVGATRKKPRSAPEGGEKNQVLHHRQIREELVAANNYTVGKITAARIENEDYATCMSIIMGRAYGMGSRNRSLRKQRERSTKGQLRHEWGGKKGTGTSNPLMGEMVAQARHESKGIWLEGNPMKENQLDGIGKGKQKEEAAIMFPLDPKRIRPNARTTVEKGTHKTKKDRPKGTETRKRTGARTETDQGPQKREREQAQVILCVLPNTPRWKRKEEEEGMKDGKVMEEWKHTKSESGASRKIAAGSGSKYASVKQKCTFGGAWRIWYGKVSTRVRVRSRREPRRARVGKSKARVRPRRARGGKGKARARIRSARMGASHGVREGKARVRVRSVRMGANHGVREGKGKPCERVAAEKESAGGAVTASAKPTSAIPESRVSDEGTSAALTVGGCHPRHAGNGPRRATAPVATNTTPDSGTRVD
ncbi:hypothetical protein B0H16DRAFT_1820771 [Mycena metata]|uniref:Uncharacterized protein n=1 Tax=Mycena metata TaxID=1033252 RepID=A0AAD7NEH9_9AGAR|nr:hypothetical protein B0H16DRAFT_1820771 [Mycena metata]